LNIVCFCFGANIATQNKKSFYFCLAHAHRKIRCGAISVSPEVRSLHTSKSGRQTPRKSSHSEKQGANLEKKTSKTKFDSSNIAKVIANNVSGDENAKIRKLSNKLMTIPEAEENLQKKQNTSPYPQTDASIRLSSRIGNLTSQEQGGLEKETLRKDFVDCPRNTPCPIEHFQRSPMPASDKVGKAMAAWVGKHTSSADRSFMETLPASAAQYLAQNQVYFRAFTDKLYKPQVYRLPTDSNPPETGKLLYKRAQTSKNTLGTITHPIFRQSQSPISKPKKDTSKPPSRTSQSPPPVFRFTHKMNRFK